MFTLDQARAFVTVAEELHFGRAAERLHMTQPPLSRQIQKLERELGLVLLRRKPRAVSLTPAGEAFLDECRQLLLRVEHAPRRARLIADGQVGVVRLGYTAASAYSVLGPLLTTFRERAPRVTIELHEMVTPQQIEALHNEGLDLGIGRPPFPKESIDSTLLLTEDLVVVVPDGHPLATRERPVTVEELEDEPIIMHSPTEARYFHELAARIMTVRPERISHTSSQVLTMVALASEGHGVALVPRSAERFAAGYQVSMLPIEGVRKDLVQLHAMWRSDSENAALRALLPLLDERAKASSRE